MAKVTKYLTGSTLEQMKEVSGKDVNVQNIKKFINSRCIDHDYENALYTYRKIQEFRRNHPHLKQKDAEAILGKGFSHGTVSRYWKPENAPVPKKIFGLVPGDEGKSRIAMTSVANDDSTILRIILRLYAGVFNSENPRFECDLTFSKGDFYRKSAPYPEFCFDLFPNQPNDLIDAPHVYPLMSEDNSESAETMLKDGSVKSIVIDLPQSISDTGESGIEGFADLKDMAVSYYNMLSLAFRKLRPESESQSGGILVVKVGDINYKGRRIWMSKIVSELATGNLTRLSDPIITELQSEANKEGKSFEEKFPLFDLMLRDKIVHLYKEDEIKKYDDENPQSLKDHDFFLIFQKGKDKTELETFFICSDNENKDSLLSNFLLEESNRLNIFSDLSKVKKSGSDKCKNYCYKVYLPKGTINDCVWSNQRVSNSIKNKLKSYRNIPEDKFETGDSLLKYLEGKKESVHEDNIENILKLNRSELDKINRKIKELEEDKNYYLSESKNKEARKLEKEIKDKLKTKKQLEKTIKENESLKKSTKKARIKSEKPLDIISEETAILLKNVGVKFIDIVYNGKKDYIKRLVLDKQDMKIEPLNPIADRQTEKRNKEIFYHGSGVLFDSFDLEHALEGDGNVKFGYGIYVT